MKSLFKAALFLILSLVFLGCAKNEESPATGGTGVGGANNMVYYIDSARIYTTDANGANSKMVVEVTPVTNLNSYLGDACVSADGNKIYFFHFVSGSARTARIAVVNKDGTGLATVANLPTTLGTTYKSLKFLSSGKLVFVQNNFGANPQTASLETINTDGTGQTKLSNVPLGFTDLQVASDGIKFVITSTATIPQAFFGQVVNNNIGDPKSIPNSKGVLSSKISKDGTKVIYAKLNGTTKIDIYSFTTATETEVLVKSVALPADFGQLPTWTVRLNWLEGSSKILLSFAKDSNFGTTTGYLNCVVMNADGSAEKSWKINNQDDWLPFTE
jgi:hypothetical protein